MIGNGNQQHLVLFHQNVLQHVKSNIALHGCSSPFHNLRLQFYFSIQCTGWEWLTKKS